MAAYDLGSNSFHLLVAEADGEGGLVELARGQEMVRLGEESLRDGIIPFASFQRGLDGLIRLRRIAEGFLPENTVAVATSAIREAKNGNDFVNTVAREVGLRVEILDPVKEANLIYWGARQALDLKDQRFALFDLGGGSMKAVVGDANQCEFATVLRMGVLRMREILPEVPTRAELLTAETRIRAAVQPTVMHMRKLGFHFVTFTSGTALALARIAEGDGQGMAQVRGASGEGLGLHLMLSLEKLRMLEQHILNTSPAGRAKLPGAGDLRGDTLLPGVLVLRTLLEMAGQEQALVCESALKEGLVVDYFVRRETGLEADLPEGD